MQSSFNRSLVSKLPQTRSRTHWSSWTLRSLPSRIPTIPTVVPNLFPAVTWAAFHSQSTLYAQRKRPTIAFNSNQYSIADSYDEAAIERELKEEMQEQDISLAEACYQEPPEYVTEEGEVKGDADSALVSTDWLEANLDKVVPVDGSWVMPFSRRDMRDEWLQNHIKHARYLEIESISMRHPILPHLLPSAEDFGKAMDTLGINKDSHVVVYDNSYLFSACRVYWMFKVFGHKNVSVLDGGLAKWVAEKRPTFSGMDDLSRLPKSQDHYKCKRHVRLVRKHADVIANFELFNQQDLGKNIDESSLEYVLDARAPDRFTGKIPEPRPGVPSGQIPYSINTHFEDLVNRNPDSNAITLKPREELRAYFEQQGVDIQKPLITSCGSGVTAAVIYLALREIGAPRVSLYDGSWLDYASRVESPMWRDYDDFAFDAPTTPLTENDLRARFDARKAYLRRKQAEALGRNSDTQQPPSHKYRS